MIAVMRGLEDAKPSCLRRTRFKITLMISTITLRAGPSAGEPPLFVGCTAVNLFVGPNNSGKSRLLREILAVCTDGKPPEPPLLLSAWTVEGAVTSDLESFIKKVQCDPQPNETLAPGQIFVGTDQSRYQTTTDDLRKVLLAPHAHGQAFSLLFLRHRTVFLSGDGRIQLVRAHPAGDLQRKPSTAIQRLFRDAQRRLELRRVIHEAFGLYLVVDPTNLGTLRLRLSQAPPPDERTELGIHPEAVTFHANAIQIDEFSDGVKAFTGIMLEIIAGDPDVILIDEPEAFLHPGLAYLLGREVSRAATREGKRVFVSTHSSGFLMGCVQSGAQPTVVRMTYRSGSATARTLPSSGLLQLMRNPLLRSTSVLNALFYESVVVTEADTDRAFYQEMNERLQLQRRGIPHCLFINAQNKQTIPKILQPLRALGIAAAGIVDIDAVKEGGNVWTTLVASVSLPGPEQQSLALLRSTTKAAFDATGRNMKTEGGLALLSGQQREAAENLFRRLSEYGLFVVRGGEVESWLKSLGVPGHGPNWLISMFEQMGEDPEDPRFRAAHGDVWEFIDSIQAWLADPNRRGIPSR